MNLKILLILVASSSTVFIVNASEHRVMVYGLFAVCKNGHAVHAHCKIKEKPNSWRNSCSKCRDVGLAKLVSSMFLDREEECSTCLISYGKRDGKRVGFPEARDAVLYIHWLQNGLEDGSITQADSDNCLHEWRILQGRVSKKLFRTHAISAATGGVGYREWLSTERRAALIKNSPFSGDAIPTTLKEIQAILDIKTEPVVD